MAPLNVSQRPKKLISHLQPGLKRVDEAGGSPEGGAEGARRSSPPFTCWREFSKTASSQGKQVTSTFARFKFMQRSLCIS